MIDLLMGRMNPSGKLAETYPMTLEDTPANGYYPAKERNSEYRESIYVGYRYFDKSGIGVRYPFGYGLTYSSFEISGLSYNTGRHAVKGKLSNKSDIDGAEIIQVYRLPDEQHDYLELVGFEKVYTRANSELDFEINVTDKVGLGKYAVGFNSADLVEI